MAEPQQRRRRHIEKLQPPRMSIQPFADDAEAAAAPTVTAVPTPTAAAPPVPAVAAPSLATAAPPVTGSKPGARKFVKLRDVDTVTQPGQSQPFSRQAPVETPAPAPAEPPTAPAPAPPKQDPRSRYEAKMRLMRQRRAPIRAQGTAGQPLPSKKERREIAAMVRQQGISAALNKVGMTDPNVHRIVAHAMQTGEIRDKRIVTERLQQYYASGGVMPVLPAPKRSEPAAAADATQNFTVIHPEAGDDLDEGVGPTPPAPTPNLAPKE